MKIVFVSIGMVSAFNASLELCRRLAADGNHVTYLGHADLEATVTAHGHAFERLEALRALAEESKGLAPSWADLRRPADFVRKLLRRRQLRRRAILEREVVEAVERLAPDLLLLDIEMHVAILKTAHLGIPTALASTWFSFFRRPGLPPLHTSLLPARTPAERRKLRVAWWRLRLETLHMEWRQRLHRWRRADFFPPITEDAIAIDDVRAVARAWKFPHRRRTSRAHWLRPWVYTDLPILSYNAEEADYPGAVPPEVPFHYVGPMVLRERVETRMGDVDRAAWAAFLDRRARQDDPPPLVYCSLGTFWSTDTAFLGRVVELARRRPDRDWVIGLGGKLDAGALGPIPSNALTLDYAPQLDVLRHASLAIVHGGSGTLNECLLHEVPMVVYSTKFVDQNGNAAHLAYHGLGILGDKDQDGVDALQAKVERALADSELRARVSAMAGHFHRYERVDGLVRSLVSAGSRS